MIANFDTNQYELLPLNFQQIQIPTELLLLQDKNILINLICEICDNIPNTPILCQECDGLFCTFCINKWMLHDTNKCCKCKTIFKEGKLNRKLMSILESIEIECLNSSRGCKVILSLQFLEKHLEECKYTIRKAKCFGCEQIFDTINENEENIHQHITKCDDIYVTCQYCFLSDKRKKMEDHLTICEDRPIQCDDCKITMSASKFALHSRKECASEIIRKYEKVIYDLKLIRKQDKETIHQLKLKLLDESKLSSNPDSNYDKMTDLIGETNTKMNDISSEFLPGYSEIRNLKGHNNYVNSLVHMNWSKDKTTLVSCSEDKTIKVWNLSNGKLIRNIDGHKDSVYCLIQMNWSLDETTIVSGSCDKMIKVWNVSDGKLIRTLKGHLHYVRCLIQMKWSKDETTIVSGSKDKTIKIWNALNGTLIGIILGHSDITCLIQMNWKKDETTIVSGMEDHTIKVWNTDTIIQTRTITGHKDIVSCLIQLKWVKDDTTIVSSSWDDTIKVWNITDGTLIRVIGEKNCAYCLIQIILNKDDTTIVCGCDDKTITIWNINDGTLINTLEGHDSYITSLCQIKLNNKKIKIASGSLKDIKIWKVDNL